MVAEDELLSGRYRLDEQIAAGAMGTVYRATDERLHRKVAVKLLKEGFADNAKFIERFRREARSAAALSHPNIAGVFDYGEDAGCNYIVMELAGGSDLARVLTESGALDPQRSAHIAAQIAAALSHAHLLGVVHRDVKPGNVLVDTGDRIKVTDFGIARAAGDSTLTATGSIMGTAHYLSPEQAAGAAVGAASDIYSLGIVLYEMLTGAVPFTGDSAISVAIRHINEDVPAPSESRPDIPPHLDEVVRRATEKDPDARYPDASAMAVALLGDGPAETSPLLGAAPATFVDESREVASAASLEDRATAVLPTGSEVPLVDPKLKKTAALVLAGLTALTLLVALASAATEDDPGRPGRAGAPEDNEPRSPGSEVLDEAFKIPTDLYGTDAILFVTEAEEAGIRVDQQPLPTDELDPGKIMMVSPEEGTVVEPGETITLAVSALPVEGEEEDEPDEDDDDEDEDDSEDKGKSEGKGKPEGKGKGKFKEDDD